MGMGISTVQGDAQWAAAASLAAFLPRRAGAARSSMQRPLLPAPVRHRCARTARGGPELEASEWGEAREEEEPRSGGGRESGRKEGVGEGRGADC